MKKPETNMNGRESAGRVIYVGPNGELGDGTLAHPFTDLQSAADSLRPGDTLALRGGTYYLSSPLFLKEQKNITIRSCEGERAILDGSGYDGDSLGFYHENGTLTVDLCAGISVRDITVVNSHCKGISVFNSNDVEISGCATENTFACGIAVWDRTPVGEKKNAFRGFRILSNTVKKANTWDMLPKGWRREGEPPHEAISIAGAADFEIAYNYVHDCDKEGIDVKENSVRGRVHHNLIERCDRQGLYADAWFGTLKDVIFDHNLVRENRGAGLAVSVEGEGSYLTDVTFEHNVVVDNFGTGCFFSRWGSDLLRENIVIRRNTFLRNGHGGHYGGEGLFWITGGMHFFSSNVRNAVVEGNIFSDDDTFEIGFSEHWGRTREEIEAALEEKKIVIRNNLIDYRDHTVFPVRVGWTDNYADVSPVDGRVALKRPPVFRDPEHGDYTAQDPELRECGIGADGDAGLTDREGE